MLVICSVFHNPTRERGTGYARRRSDISRSFAYVSGLDEYQKRNFKTRERGTVLRHRGDVHDRSLAHASGCDFHKPGASS